MFNFDMQWHSSVGLNPKRNQINALSPTKIALIFKQLYYYCSRLFSKSPSDPSGAAIGYRWNPGVLFNQKCYVLGKLNSQCAYW